MSDGPWFKCYPSDFLNGVADLSPNELAVYTICLMRMYDEDGPIPENLERIARRCNMRPTACKKALDALCLDPDKLVRRDGMLINPKAEKVIKSRQKVGEKSAHSARTRWGKVSENTNEINERDMRSHEKTDANGMPTRSQKLDTRKKDAPNGASKEKRGARLPDDWAPGEDLIRWARSEGYPDDHIQREIDKFRDYWPGQPGAKGRKLDWAGTFRNWLRNSGKPAGRSGGPVNGHEAMFAAFGAVAGRGGDPGCDAGGPGNDAGRADQGREGPAEPPGGLFGAGRPALDHGEDRDAAGPLGAAEGQPEDARGDGAGLGGEPCGPAGPRDSGGLRRVAEGGPVQAGAGGHPRPGVGGDRRGAAPADDLDQAARAPGGLDLMPRMPDIPAELDRHNGTRDKPHD